MLQRLREILQDIIDGFRGVGREALWRLRGARGVLLLTAIAAAAGYALYRNPPIKTVARGEVGIRTNRLSGEVSESRDGSVLVFPGLQDLRIFSLRDQAYGPAGGTRAEGPSPFQSVEGPSPGAPA